MGQGITGWVAEHKEPVSVTQNAARDPRFRLFNELPEDSYEAFLSVPLLSRGNVVGVINLQHRGPHVHTRRQIRLIATAGFLVGAEIELACLEEANSNLSEKLQTRKLVERARAPIAEHRYAELRLVEQPDSCSSTRPSCRRSAISFHSASLGCKSPVDTRTYLFALHPRRSLTRALIRKPPYDGDSAEVRKN